MAHEKWYEYCARIIADQERGCTLATQSVLDLYNVNKFGDPVGLPSTDNWLTPFGMGNFIALLSEGLPIQVGTPVTAIDWGDNGGVSIATDRGTVKASKAIITIPPKTLLHSGPTFTPSLPASHLDAMAKLPTAAVEKVGLQFSTNVFTDVEGPNEIASLLVNAPNLEVAQSRLWGKNVAIVIVGGPFVIDHAKEGKPALIQYALDGIKDLFGGNPAKHLERSNSSTRWTDPYSLGGFSYVGPGDVPARTAFAQPLDDQLFFAGEACQLERHSSLVAAWETGRSAA